MKLLIANPNRSQELLDQMMEAARKFVDPSKVELIPLLNPSGSTHLDCYFGEVQSTWSYTRAVLAAVKEKAIDAVVIAGFGNFGVFALKEALEIPVLSLAECSHMLASMIGHRYCVLTVLEQNVGYQEDLVRLFGFDRKCASVRGLDIDIARWSTDEEVFQQLKAKVEYICKNDSVDVIVLGGARFAIYAKRLEQETGVTIIDPLKVTVKQAEMMVETGLSQAKKTKFHLPTQPIDAYCYTSGK